jgi:hypothetical protein
MTSSRVAFLLTINGIQSDVSSVEQLRSRLSKARERQPFLDVWLSAPSGWPTLCALINGDATWMIYFRHDRGGGFLTRNPAYDGPQNATIKYRLSNGQIDEYPAAWNVTTVEAVRALEEFFARAERPAWLHWHEP